MNLMEPLEGRRLLSSSITTEFYNGDDPSAQGNLGDGIVNDGEKHVSIRDVMGHSGPTAIDVPQSSHPGGPKGGGNWTPRTDIDIIMPYGHRINVPAGTEVTFVPNDSGGWRITGFIVPKGGKAPGDASVI